MLLRKRRALLPHANNVYAGIAERGSNSIIRVLAKANHSPEIGTSFEHRKMAGIPIFDYFWPSFSAAAQSDVLAAHSAATKKVCRAH